MGIRRIYSTIRFGLALTVLCHFFGSSFLAERRSEVWASGGTSSSSAGFSIPAVPQTQAPNWDALNKMSSTAIMSSCSNPTQTAMNGLQNLMTMMGTDLPPGGCGIGPAISLESSCPAGMGMPTDTGMTCDNYNPQAARNAKMGAFMAYCAESCTEALKEAWKAEMMCLQGMLNSAMTMAKEAGQTINNNILLMQKQVAAYKLAIQDRTLQLQNVDKVLNGDPSSKKPGLLQARDQTRAILDSIGTEINTISASQMDIDNWETGMPAMMQMKKMSDTMKCFNTQNISKFQCQANEASSHTSRDEAVCLLQNYVNGGSSTNSTGYQVNALTQKQAQSQAAQLSTLLDQMNSMAPVIPDYPSSPEEYSKLSGQSRLVKSPNDLQQFATRLRSFKLGPNLDAYKFVMDSVNYCYSIASKQQSEEMKDPKSKVGAAPVSILTARKALVAQMNPLFQKYKTQAQNNASSVGSVNIQLPACDQTSSYGKLGIANSVSCLTNYKNILSAQYYGSRQSMPPIVINGVEGQGTSFKIACNGILGCINTVQNVRTNLNNNLESLNRQLPAYVSNANTTVKQNTQAMVQGKFAGISQIINQKVAMLVAKGRIFGGNMSPPQPMRGEQVQPDSEYAGLMKPLNDPTSFVGGLANLPDPRSLQFSPPPPSQNSPRLMAEIMRLTTLGRQCAMQGVRQSVEALNSINAQNCGNQTICTEDRVASLTRDIAKLGGGNNLMPGIAASLSSGLATVCDPSNMPIEPKEANYRNSDGKLNESWGLARANFERDSRATGCAQYIATLQSTVKGAQSVLGQTPRTGSSFGGF